MDSIDALRALGNRVTPMHLWKACRPVLWDGAFLEGIASASHHPKSHQVPGGLVLHTLEVAQASVEMAGTDKELAARAYVAAVFHDYGKIHEYAVLDGVTVKLPFAQMIGHIVYGWRFFLEAANMLALGEEETAEIAHALLAHHGRREFGSPVTPQTKLAMILHTADGMSARGLVQCS
jgi:3'-5' exoribonuclease